MKNHRSKSIRFYCLTAWQYFCRYFLMILWLIVASILFVKYFLIYHNQQEYYFLKRMLGLGLCFSRGTVPIINITMVLMMIPVCKTFNKFMHKILSRISIDSMAVYLEKLKPMHQILAVTLVGVSIIHSIAHVVNVYNFIQNYDKNYPELNWAKKPGDNFFRLLFATPTGFSGVTMLACLIIIAIFSTKQMRTYFYNSFLGVHHLFLVLIIMSYYHPLSNIIKYQSNIDEYNPQCEQLEDGRYLHPELLNFTTMYCQGRPIFTSGKKMNWIFPTVTLGIFLFDLGFRYFSRFFLRLRPLLMEPVNKNCLLMKFKLNENVRILPGQFILLQSENISKLEWHPFTVTDCIRAHKKTIFTLAISVRGDWTDELYRKIYNIKTYLQNPRKKRHRGRRRGNPVPRKLKFIFDGPFPSPMESIVDKQKIVLIAAGIGITPYIAIFNYMLKTEKPLPISRIHLVWITRDINHFSLFCTNLCDLNQKFWNENKPDKFQIRFYLTNDEKRRRISFLDEEDETLGDQELFGKHAAFVTSRLYAGRPVWNYLFQYWVSLYGKDSIHVFSCGPKSMNQEVRQHCYLYNNLHGCNFHFLHSPFS